LARIGPQPTTDSDEIEQCRLRVVGQPGERQRRGEPGRGAQPTIPDLAQIDLAHRRRHHGNPGARGDQIDVGQHVRDLGHHHRLEARCPAGEDQVLVDAWCAGPAHQDEALLRQFGQL